MGFSERLKNLNYRTLDQILDEVKVDLYSLDQESSIQTAELIKIVQQCNYDLGLRITQTKETILEIEHGKCKLPADFQIMNFALMSYEYRVTWGKYGYPTGYGNQVVTPNPAQPLAPTLTTCPCWTVVSLGAQTSVVMCDGTTESVYFPPEDDGSARTTKVCAMSISPNPNLTLTEGSGCYWDAVDGYICPPVPAVPDPCSCDTTVVDSCVAINPDPWKQARIQSFCKDSTSELVIVQENQGYCREYTNFVPVTFVPTRYASDFSNPNRFPINCLQAQIKSGFIYIPSVNCGKLYINYQGVLEDEEGNLMALDHPMINMYYESAVKERVLQNLYFNTGDERYRTLWKEMKLIYQEDRQRALSIANTPEVYEMQQTYNLMKRTKEWKYFNPFSKYFGNVLGIVASNEYFI